MPGLIRGSDWSNIMTMTRKIPELLAPAGTPASALAAFDAGADAVYAGLGKFNARERGENFDTETLSRVVDYAHKLHKKVYVTLNTLIKEPELPEVVEMLKKRMYAWVEKREKETGRTAPIYTNFLRPEGPFKTSEEAYMGKYIGGIADAVKLQQKQ